ncbi:MAG TPA: hypothetical protein PLJ29_09940, partial [Leptospiraceae bacterium]|nr:hypothetical protein [Leptospiraceae bacterium]
MVNFSVFFIHFRRGKPAGLINSVSVSDSASKSGRQQFLSRIFQRLFSIKSAPAGREHRNRKGISLFFYIGYS